MKNINGIFQEEQADDGLGSTYLTFKIASQYYGIPINNVIEIIQLQPATEMPQLPFYSKGIINLRGQIVPLIDVNLRFGKPERAYTDRTCIIIVDIGGVHTGLIVDAVEEVLDIDDNLTSRPPAFSGDDQENYITRIARLEKSMVLLIDVHLMVSNSDMELLTAV